VLRAFAREQGIGYAGHITALYFAGEGASLVFRLDTGVDL
jgi:hypothetical protein